MANNHNVYREKTNPALTVLYIIVVLALIAANAYMYMNWREKQHSYNDMVLEAAASEKSMTLESRKSAYVPEDEAEEGDLEAVAEPSPEPTEAPVVEAMEALPETPVAPADQVALPDTDEIALPDADELGLFSDSGFQDADFESDLPEASDDDANP